MARRSWKRFLVIVVFLSIACAVFSEDQVTLRFPHWFFGHGSSFADWINGAVDAFEKENPNIKVDREQVPYEQYWDKLDTAIAGGNAPDIGAFGPSNLGKYIEAGTLIPLNDLIDMADVKKNFSSLQTVEIPRAAADGKTYALVRLGVLPSHVPAERLQERGNQEVRDDSGRVHRHGEEAHYERSLRLCLHERSR